MNLSLKRHFYSSLMVIYALAVLLYRIIYWELPPREFLISFPLIALVFFPPFRFTRPRVVFRKGWVRKKDGQHVHSEIRFEDIARIEGSSIFGVLPTLTISSKDGTVMDLPLKAEGVLELEQSLLPLVEGSDGLHSFFRYYRILIQETNALELAMIGWLRLSVLFGVVAPYLVWDDGMIAEHLVMLTLIWFTLTAGSAFMILLFFAGFNRIVALISMDFAEKHIGTIRSWLLLILFFSYLVAGFRFCEHFFS